MTNETGFNYIQTKDGELFKKGFYFSESDLKEQERIIWSPTEKPSKQFQQYHLKHAEVITDAKDLTFEETFSFGHKDKLKIFYKGYYLGEFYYNMRGYVMSFSIQDETGCYAEFGEKGKSTVIRELKDAIKRGFVYFRQM